MLVFKFGGASVKDADAVRNLSEITKLYSEKLVVVVSAMGKMTNALEKLFEQWFKNEAYHEELEIIKAYHIRILNGLFNDSKHKVYDDIQLQFEKLEERLATNSSGEYDFEYDQIVSFGEIFSTLIVAAFLNEQNFQAKWMDIRKYLKTDDTFREGVVNFEESGKLMREAFDFKDTQVYLTQGFLGSGSGGYTTTLGREGSDYTAAILAYALHAEQVTIWKDVPGVLNADPKWFDNTVKLDQLSYLDAIELAYYGTSVIHPKTIQPLRNKNINLYVKSFLHPNEPGTLINNFPCGSNIPMFIFKMDQVLIRIYPNDFSFIAEEKLKSIFGYFTRHNININLMQNSAVSFQVCVNNAPLRLLRLIEDLNREFKVNYETGLELITIRYYDDQTIRRVMENKEFLLEQKNHRNIQLVVRDRG
jgi:aspartate kinase